MTPRAPASDHEPMWASDGPFEGFRCITHGKRPINECFRALESENCWQKARKEVIEKERDAAQDKMARALVSAQKARDEAEALRTGVNKAMDLLEDSPDGPQLDLAYDVLNQALGAARRANRDARPHQWAEGGFCNTHMTYGCGKARLSAPAPAPKVNEERLMENLKDFKTFDNRMHGKPPAPVCSCPYRSTRSGRCTNCGMPVRKPAPGGRER